MLTSIPQLEPHCGSWMATSSSGQVLEVWDREDAEQLAKSGWRIETAAAYLGRLNTKIKAAS